MNRNEIVKRFSDMGVLISPELLNKINENNIDFYIKNIGSSPVVTEKDEKVNVELKKDIKKDKLEISDFVEYFNNRYNALRKVLLEKISPVSITNLKNTYSNVSIIGMVREIKSTGFVVEDATGSIEVMSSNHPDMDDVVGIKGSAKEGKFFANEIIYPDVPESNRLRKIDVKILIAKKFDGKESNANFIFAEESNVKGDNIFSDFTNPSHIAISKGNNKINMVVFKPDEGVNMDNAVNYLVKRYLKTDIKNITSSEDQYLLEPLPDILWILGKKKWSKTYRNVTVISCGEGSALIDLEKREVEFL